jgi:hypothetical protein
VPHRFGADLARLRIRTPIPDAAYVELFRGARDERIVAEASVWTMRSEVAADEIAAFDPGARIVVMLRDPVEMLASLHGELCRAGVEDIPDLRAALDAELDRAAGRRLPRGVPFTGQLRYSQAVDFPDQLGRLADRFGADRVHVVLLDDLRTDPAAVVDGVQRFLGLDPDPGVVVPRVNEGRAVRAPRVQRFARQPGAVRSLTRRFVPASMRPTIARGVVRTIERANLARASRAPVPDDLAAELRERYRPVVDELAAMLHRDLSAWTTPRQASNA